MKNSICPHCGKEINVGKLLKEQDKTKKKCVFCGAEFLASGSAKFCCNACKCKAYRERKKQK